MSDVTYTLPKDSATQTFVSVKAIAAGYVFLSICRVFEDCTHTPPGEGSLVPSFAFLIEHPTHGMSMFDLGLKKNNEGYPPAVVALLPHITLECKEDVADVLYMGGIKPEAIKRLIYSHLHLDHVGDFNKFPTAEIVIGAGGKSVLEDAYPANPSSMFEQFPAGRKVTYVDFADAKPMGTFEHAVDFFGDGSLYLVDAPGHIPGHLGAFARVAPDAFLFLAADICHDRLCYAPGARVVNAVSHVDHEEAKKMVEKLARLHKEVPEAVVVLAHETERKEEMPMFPGELGPWVAAEVEKRRAFDSKPSVLETFDGDPSVKYA